MSAYRRLSFALFSFFALSAPAAFAGDECVPPKEDPDPSTYKELIWASYSCDVGGFGIHTDVTVSWGGSTYHFMIEGVCYNGEYQNF
jgi:hypothetical protein